MLPFTSVLHCVSEIAPTIDLVHLWSCSRVPVIIICRRMMNNDVAPLTIYILPSSL